MRKKYPIIILLPLISCFFTTCIDQIQVPVRHVSPTLVVEGLLTNDSTSYYVKLSYSRPINDTNKNYISGAEVSISDQNNNSISLSEIGPGYYVTNDPNFIGKVNNIYTLNITLPNGKKYVSHPETMLPVPPIDSLVAEYQITPDPDMELTGYNIYLYTKDPPDTANFYRWTTSGYIRRQAGGIPCTPGTRTLCEQFCWQPIHDTTIRIFSDAQINGNEIKHYFVNFSPAYAPGKHFIEVTQYSLSKRAYQFWQNYQEQLQRTGSTLDPLPAPVKGNVYNAADSTDIALGYFEVSAITKKRLIIPVDVNYSYQITNQGAPYIRPGACTYAFPGTMKDEPNW